MELTKKDKKAARELIEIGLQRDFEDGLVKIEKILCNWRNKSLDNREAYHTVFKQVDQFNDYIASRYDNITGSHYLTTVVCLMMDKVVTENDLDDFSEEVQLYIKSVINNLS